MPAPPPVAAQLKITQLWRGEVMAERVLGEAPATIGHLPGCMFILPDLGIPAFYQLFAYTEAGLVLNLHSAMRGTLSIGGRTTEVSELLGGAKQRSVILNVKDWGLVELGEGAGGEGTEAEHQFFFQLGAPALAVGSSLGPDFVPVVASYGYSVFIHAVAVVLIFLFYVKDDKDTSRQVFARLITPKETPAATKAEEPPPDKAAASADDGEDKAPPASTAGEGGKSGGEGDRPRSRSPEGPPKGDPMVTKVLNRGVLKHRDKLAAFGEKNALDKRLDSALARMKGPYAEGGLGFGAGHGTGVGAGTGTGTLTRGTGTGPGGDGTAHNDVVTAEAIKTGGVRSPRGGGKGTGVTETKVSVSTGEPDGDFGDLTQEQILKVVKAHQGAITYCFEKELQRVPGLQGKIVLTWRIDDTGKVTSSKVKSSTMGNANVEDCLARQVRSWKFPAPSGGSQAVVNFPFFFQKRG
jgi:TonB family protein